MPYHSGSAWSYLLVAAALLAGLISLTACGDLRAALPPRPSPFPTLARLPSVTPVIPSPTYPPTVTPLAGSGTPTPELLLANVAVAANMRSGPGLDFDIVAVLDAGSSIGLRRRQGEWYEVVATNGSIGWMFASVLTIDPAIAEAVPAAQP